MDGAAFGLHSEAPLVPWDVTIVRDGPSVAEILLRTELARYPFALERRMKVRQGTPRLEIEDKVLNQGNVGLQFFLVTTHCVGSTVDRSKNSDRDPSFHCPHRP